MEYAATPGELVRRLFDEQKLDPIIIPHGTTWGMYTPAGTSWDKALDPAQRPDRFSLIEVYSGHGDSEEYRSWDDVRIDGSGKATCPEPVPGYTPSCWRAGELIHERCVKAGIANAECDHRAAEARQNYVTMGIAGHLTVPGASAADWLDAGQCTDCFLPSFNYRPKESVQAGLAMSHFDDATGQATRFTWGFIGSSDNHKARPGTGYKQYDRRGNTEASGPASEAWFKRMMPDEKWDDENPKPRNMTQDEILALPGLSVVEYERRASFLRVEYPGPLPVRGVVCLDSSSVSVRAAKVVVREMKRDGGLQVFQLLAESVGQASKSAHAHAHGQVLTLNQACRNMNRVWTTCDDSPLHMRHLRRGVACRACRFCIE